MGNVFNRYGGGKSEGLYIWKKSVVSEYKKVETDIPTSNTVIASGIGNITLYGAEHFDYTFDTATGVYTLTSPSIINELVVGEAVTFNSNKKIIINATSGTIVYSAWSSGYNNTYTWSADGTLSVKSNNNSYKGSIFSAEPSGYSLVEYVVSDKEDAYPDKEVKDGFYYERVVLSPSAFGCTRYEVGKIHNAMSSNSLVVNHSLGELPKFAYLWQTDMSTGLSAGVYAFNPNATNEIHWATLAGNYISPYSGSSSAYEETDKRVIFLGYTTSSAKFTVADYHYILFA